MAKNNTALVIRTSDKNRVSRNGFQWPESGPVKCPDWNPKPVCGQGLHGLLDGIGHYGLLSSAHDAVWQLVEVDRTKVIDLDGEKVKFEEGNVVFTGGMAGALTRISKEWLRIAFEASKEAATSGNDAHAATSGDR
ncbi:DUF7666 domain-containing protein, partial [Cupriavidus basilensis]|uniref:DUF7666 domain-containing protein n=1 Tax=Cupriavidus basilensis TaxID=68895 RepID=UPI0018CF3349